MLPIARAAAAAGAGAARAAAAAMAGTRGAHTSASAVALLEKHFSPAVPRAPRGNNIVVDHAKGCWITAVDGKKYLDLQTGIGVANTGHAHPRVVAAVQAQVAKGIHLQQNCVISQPVLELLDRLSKVAPPGLSRFFFNCTGTEAVESAVKLARHETGRQNVITFKGGFHGRSLTTLAMTSSKTAYGVGYGPLPSGIFQTQFPMCVHCNCARPSGTDCCCNAALESLNTLFKETTAPSDTAAIVLEPVLGEGGYVAPPPGFFKALRALCDKHGIMLVADEVQTGVGRTGTMWAVEHEGVTPDIMVFAKAIASGLPLSGIATRGDMMKKSPPGSMGGTFGANAVSAAAAVATLDAVVEEKMPANAAARGAQLSAALRGLQTRFPDHILDVRGRGCMVGLEFKHAPGSGFAGDVTANCMPEGLLLFTAGWREIIRFIPPLVITEAEMATAIDMFTRGFEKTVKQWEARMK